MQDVVSVRVIAHNRVGCVVVVREHDGSIWNSESLYPSVNVRAQKSERCSGGIDIVTNDIAFTVDVIGKCALPGAVAGARNIERSIEPSAERINA